MSSDAVKHPNDWSRDGRFLLYDDHHPSQRQDLWVVPLEGTRTPIPFLATPADETSGAFSPDGRWVAYSSDESGRREVHVRGFESGSPLGHRGGPVADLVGWRRQAALERGWENALLYRSRRQDDVGSREDRIHLRAGHGGAALRHAHHWIRPVRCRARRSVPDQHLVRLDVQISDHRHRELASQDRARQPLSQSVSLRFRRAPYLVPVVASLTSTDAIVLSHDTVRVALVLVTSTKPIVSCSIDVPVVRTVIGARSTSALLS